jgi:hypothetical protein
MTRRAFSCFRFFALFTLVMLLGCATPQTQSVHADPAVACIRGVVSYNNPTTSTMVPYSSVSVTAWRHGTDKGLAEVNADKDGKYCIEVPTDAKTVDLRVWGLEFFQGNNYVCEGSADSVDLGSISGKCGSGTCLKVDIHAECRERAMRNRGF